MKNHNYATCKSEYSYRYMTIPEELFENPQYVSLSAEAKLLYGALLRRTALSLQSHFLDSQGRAYVFMPRAEVQKLLHCGEKTATKVFAELRQADLIEEVRQPGIKAANKIYVKYPEQSKHNKEAKKKAKAAKKALAEQRKEYLKMLNSKIKARQQHLAKLEQKAAAKQEYLRSQSEQTVTSDTLCAVKARVDIDRWKVPSSSLYRSAGLVDAAVEAMAEMETAPSTKIEQTFLPKERMQSVMGWLEPEHFEKVLLSVRQSMSSIGNLKAYLKTALYNAALYDRTAFTMG